MIASHDEIEKFLRRMKFENERKVPVTPEIINQVRVFLIHVEATKNLFSNFIDNKQPNSPKNILTIRAITEFNEQAEKLRSLVGKDLSNIKSITIRGKNRSAATFKNNVFSKALLDALFLEDVPGSGDKYGFFKRKRIVLRATPWQIPKQNQFFRTIIEKSRELGKLIHNQQARRVKKDTQDYIMKVLRNFHPEVCTQKPEAETKTFIKYLFPHLKN